MSGTVLTLLGLQAALADMPQVSPFRWCVCKPEHMRRLVQDFKLTDFDSVLSSFGGIQLFVKSGQTADAWMFSDQEVLQKYLDGKLCEGHQALRDFKELASTGKIANAH